MPGLTDHAAISAAILNLGRELVACSFACEGIQHDQKIGSLPRCLVFDAEGRSNDRGCAIVGINPGRASNQEQAFYRTHECTYDAVVTWFVEHGLNKHRYYRRLRDLVDQIGLSGAILWTELAKCENKKDVRALPLQTFRTCTGHFLTRELACLPDNWPVIAVGGEAFRALAYLYPRRPIIGVPHPTGSHGHFARLFTGSNLLPHVVSLVRASLLSQPSGIVWLKSETGTAGPEPPL